MKNWDSTNRVLVQLRKMSRGTVYPVRLRETSEKDWEATICCDDGSSYKFHPTYLEKLREGRSAFQIAYDAIAVQFFQEENDARKWAKEKHRMDLSQDNAKVKTLYFESYHVRLVSGELHQISGCAKWAVHEALKTIGGKAPNSSIEED